MRALVVALLALPLGARAEEPPPDEPPPPTTLVAPLPDPRYMPRPIEATQPPPMMSREIVESDLESRARGKKVAGAVLMALGVVAEAGSLALTTIAETQITGTCARAASIDVPAWACSAQWIGGTLLGVAAMFAAEVGMVVYIVGGAQMRRALKMSGRLDGDGGELRVIVR
jgi:hypothetical protein